MKISNSVQTKIVNFFGSIKNHKDKSNRVQTLQLKLIKLRTLIIVQIVDSYDFFNNFN